MPSLTDIAKRAIAVLACVAVLSAAGLGLWVYSLRAENKALGEAMAQAADDLRIERDLRAADQAVASRYAKEVAKLTTKHRRNHADLQQAIAADPAWAAGRVPDAVADALGLRDTQ
jgi:hypothetical protein